MGALVGAAIVTGGASGLGAATARRLVAQGMAVLVCDVNASAATELADELGARAQAHCVDVVDAEALLGAAQRAGAMDPHGLRVSVACAGIGLPQRLVGRDALHSVEDFRRVVEVNLLGSFHLLRAAASVMAANDPVEEERGVCIQTASVAAFEGQIGQLAYAGSKGGVAAMTLPAARELASIGVRVCSIAPGSFDTPMLQALPAATREGLARAVPFPGRLGRPEEYASLVAHIVSNQMLNGETIRLDGALRMTAR